MKLRSMNALIAGLSIGLVAAAGAFAQQGKEGKKDGAHARAKVGEKAPEFALKDLDGKEHKLSDFAGKIVVLEWVNPGCPVCKGAHNDGRIKKMVDEFSSAGDVVFLGINSTHNTTVEDNRNALKAYKIEYPVLLDQPGTVGNLYGARTTPHVFVIDTKGILRYQGALDDDKTGNNTKDGKPVMNYVTNAVRQIKAGETVSPNTTQSYGCSVKYAAGKEGEGKPKTDKPAAPKTKGS